MEKFFRYLLIIFSLVFVVFFLSPSGRGRSTPAGFFSSVDNTRAIGVLAYHNGFLWWQEAHRLRKGCATNQHLCGIHPLRYRSFEKIDYLSDSFSRKSVDYKEAKDVLYKEWLESENRPFEELPGLKRVLKIGAPLYDEYLKSQREVVEYLTWAINFLFILIGLFLVSLRKKFSAFMCRIFGISATMVGKLHEKI